MQGLFGFFFFIVKMKKKISLNSDKEIILSKQIPQKLLTGFSFTFDFHHLGMSNSVS